MGLLAMLLVGFFHESDRAYQHSEIGTTALVEVGARSLRSRYFSHPPTRDGSISRQLVPTALWQRAG